MKKKRTPRAADLVLRNGRIYTVDRERPWAEAVAICNGKLAAVGTGEEAAALIGPKTRVIDLGGKMVMPGINDVHIHAVLGGRSELYECKFLPSLAFDEILETVRAYVAKTPEGEWVVGGIWGSDLLGKLSSAEARKALDEASHGHPVVLHDDTQHNRWVNTRALELAGIGAETPDPAGGEIVRERPGGEPAGLLLEAAAALIDRAALSEAPFTAEKNIAAAAHAVEILNSLGVTGFQDAGATAPMLSAFKSIDEKGELSAWVVASLPFNGSLFGNDVIGDELIAQREGYRSRHVKPDFVKIFLDGVPTAQTAAFLEPYLPGSARGACFRGGANFSVPELARTIAKYEKEGLGLKIHATGDASVRVALDAIDIVRSFARASGRTHHIAHASYIDPTDIARFKSLNVVADLSPILWYPGPILNSIKAVLGDERAVRFWPNRDLHESGALIAAGSDWPVMPTPNPWKGIEGMVTRRDPDDEFDGALWPEQALDLKTVLDVYTINSARAMGLDRVTGSLTAGKSADLIVLDKNLFDVAVDEIADTKVLMTVFEGRVVYQRT